MTDYWNSRDGLMVEPTRIFHRDSGLNFKHLKCQKLTNNVSKIFVYQTKFPKLLLVSQTKKYFFTHFIEAL